MYERLSPTGQCKPEVAIGIKSKNTIPDAYITASENNHIAKKARLNGPGGWWMRCNRNLPCNEQWIQVNVGKIAKITGIETQGASYQSQMYYTEKYRLSYSNGSTFNDYNNRQVLHGNNDSNTIVHNELTPAITAIYVRLHPMKDKSGYIALRMELYECKDDEDKC
ncbi:Discoidin, CUB and LCCL domain-containing protein 2 [Exaiptasia diaphana]|nr:Discoidin, CUB and LCCL domain-containing protein 2 [Exaiptasia diaphana]